MKYLGYLGSILLTVIVAILLYQFAFWITPWFLSQKGWFLVLFWLIISTPFFMLTFQALAFILGLPYMLMVKESWPRFVSSIILVVMGFFGCLLPWALDCDYKNTLIACNAITLTICIAALFVSAIVVIWINKDE